MPSYHDAVAFYESPFFERVRAIRRDLHAHPELSWQEHRTARRVAEVLDELKIPYTRGVAGTGVVADLPGPSGAPIVALRADMDALPITEETGLPFASQNAGVMHACGHDGHTAILLGAAELLAREATLPAPVRLIFQPAEEQGSGAKAMVDAGVLDGVGAVFGGHVDRNFSAGAVAATPGAVNASTDCFTVRLSGRGGHAARPHETIDAVAIGALLVASLQTIVSRETNPLDPAVVTVGRFAAGTAANVIASEAHLEGSIRALDPAVRSALHGSVRRIAESVAAAHGAAAAVTIDRGTPPVVNHVQATDWAHQAATAALGAGAVARMPRPSMGGEDFSYYQEKVPGCFVRFGTASAEDENFPTHTSRFDFDERALVAGAVFFHAVAQVAGKALADRVVLDRTNPGANG